MMRSPVWGLAVAILLGSLGSATTERQAPTGQAPESTVQTPQSQPERPRFSVNSELVLLSVTVKNSRNDYVTGLPKEAFAVLDNGQLQTLRFFITEDAPATIGILVDNSGSMVANRELVVSAATAFAETSNPEDDLFAFAFNEDVQPALPPNTPFTNDPGVLRKALERVTTTHGRTALYDAIARGLEHLDLGSHQRKVLVVVSDGDDNASETRFEHILQEVQASNVVLYAVYLMDPVDPGSPKHLKDLAEASGGEVFRPRNTREVSDVLQRIARDIRHTYVLAYEPSDTTRALELRRLRVTVQSPDKRKLSVRTRAGYLPGSPGRSDERRGRTP